MVVLIGLDRWPRAIDPPRVLDEEFSLFETDGSRGVRARCLLDAKGRQTLPNLGRSRLIPSRGSEMGRHEASLVSWSLQIMQTCLWVSSDPLDCVFGRIMVSSLVLRVVGGRGLSRNVSFARRFPFQDVGEYTQTCVHGAGAPNVASAKHVFCQQFLFRPRAPRVRKPTSGIEDAHS